MRSIAALRARRRWVWGIALWTIAATAGFRHGEAALGTLAPRCCSLERVEVIGRHRLGAEELAAHLALAPGESLAGLDFAAVRDRLRAHPIVAEAFVTRIASTLVVRIAERHAEAALCRDGDGGEPASGELLLDGSGVAFAAVPPGADPELVRICAPDGVSRRVLRGALDGIEVLRSAGLAVAEWRLRTDGSDGTVEVRLRNFPPKLVFGPGDRGEQLDGLARALAFPESAAADAIDLRFRNQVVLRPNRRAGQDAVPTERSAQIPARQRGDRGGR